MADRLDSFEQVPPVELIERHCRSSPQIDRPLRCNACLNGCVCHLQRELGRIVDARETVCYLQQGQSAHISAGFLATLTLPAAFVQAAKQP